MVFRSAVYFTESAKYASSAVTRLRRSDFMTAWRMGSVTCCEIAERTPRARNSATAMIVFMTLDDARRAMRTCTGIAPQRT